MDQLLIVCPQDIRECKIHLKVTEQLQIDHLNVSRYRVPHVKVAYENMRLAVTRKTCATQPVGLREVIRLCERSSRGNGS
jgi:hypothetical protein